MENPYIQPGKAPDGAVNGGKAEYHCLENVCEKGQIPHLEMFLLDAHVHN